jgi:hypothetical protein
MSHNSRQQNSILSVFSKDIFLSACISSVKVKADVASALSESVLSQHKRCQSQCYIGMAKLDLKPWKKFNAIFDNAKVLPLQLSWLSIS